MCAALHEYRSSGEQTGGLTGKVDISLEMDPVAHLWLTHRPTGVPNISKDRAKLPSAFLSVEQRS